MDWKNSLTPRNRKLIAWLAGFFVLFAVTGFLILPPIVKRALVKNLSEALHRQVTIETVRINPFKLSMIIRGFDVREKDSTEPFVAFDELLVNLQSLSLFKKGFVIKEVKLLNPYARIIRNEDLSYNFSDLIPQKEAEQDREPAEPLFFSVNNIQIRDARIDFSDMPRQTNHTLRDGNLAIPFISNRAADVETFVKPEFSANINGRQVAFSGDTKLFADSLETTLNIDLGDLDIPHYLAYSPVAMDYQFVSGSFTTKATVSYIQFEKKDPVLRISGTAGLRTIEIQDKPGNQMVNLPAVDLTIISLEPLAAKIHLSEALVRDPSVVVDRDKEGRVNLQALIPDKKKPTEKKGGHSESKEGSVVFAVDTFRLTDGRVAFHDAGKQGSFSTVFAPVSLAVDHLTNIPEKTGKVDFSARTEADETIHVSGDLTLNPLRIAGTVSAANLSINKYAYYYGDAVLFDIPKGSLDISTGFVFDESKARISGLTASLNSLTAVRQGEKDAFVNIPKFAVADAGMDFFTKEINLGKLSTEKGRLKFIRSKDGVLNIAGLFPRSEAENGRRDTPSKEGAGKTSWLSSFVKVFSKDFDEPDRPWLMELDTLTVEGYDLRFEDRVPEDGADFTFEKTALRADDISTARGKKGELSLSFVFDRRGYIATKGSVSINPVSAELRVDTKKMPVISFQPYFTDRVRIYVSDGHVTSAGNLSMSYEKKSGTKLSYRGKGSLDSFASVDKDNADDFLKWETLHLDGIDFGYNPFQLKINEIALSDFYSRLIINADGSLNVQRVIVREREQVKADKTVTAEAKQQEDELRDKKKSGREMKIDQVTVQGGTINFTDNYIQPNYSASFLEVGGRISGLSSEENTLADVDLKGKLENYAPLDIRGKINPLKEELFIDLEADFSDMDLSPLTPYAGKYMGYTIEKGKLSLDLKYLIVKKKLDSENKVRLDQLTLGDAVESPDATKLPVKLAIALLKNRKGEIDLDIPVTGNLDDPEFSLGKIIIKVIVNLLVKAATSPFALLGAVFGGGEEMSYVEFSYGSTEISPEAVSKVQKLIKALYDRPSLKLDIEGHADMEHDREALHNRIYDRKIKAQKLKDMIRNGFPAEPVDQIKVEPDEYPRYLKMAYTEEKFPKPRNFLGFAKDLPVPEMEKLIRTHIIVTEDDLRKLASARALALRETIVKTGQVEAERVFLVEPKTLEPEKKDKLKNSRVDFKLK